MPLYARPAKLNLDDCAAVSYPYPLIALFIFINTYFPWSISAPYQGDQDALYGDLYGSAVMREASGEPGGTITSLDTPIARSNSVRQTDHSDLDVKSP